MARSADSKKKPKRKSDEIKIQILEALKSGKAYTFSRLSEELGTSYVTITSNSEFLKLLDLIEVSILSGEESASGRSRSLIRITKKGKELLDNMEK